MPFRSRISLASGTGSSTRHNSSGKEDDFMDPEKHIGIRLGTPTPLTPGALKHSAHANMDSILPEPVQSRSSSSGQRGPKSKKKNARISGGLRVHWDRLRRRIGTGTAPSTSSAIDESIGESSGFRTRMGTAVMNEDADEVVDEVVVDREWSDEIKSSSVTHSEHGASPEKTGSNHMGGTNTDRDSFAIHNAEGFWGSCTPLIHLRWRLWPLVYGFFATRFVDEKSESHYRKENWFLRKSLAMWSTAFFVANWALGIGFIPKPVILPDQIFYYAIAPSLTFPIVPMVLLDWPRDKSTIYQIFLACSTWQWGLYQLIFIYGCGRYGGVSHWDCGSKDFLLLFFYTSALQTIAIFGLKLHRFPAMVGAIIWLVLACVFIVPNRTGWVRNVINFVFFQGFLLYVHYMRESAERRLYTLRDQLKVQFRATQKAQVNERKAADSKRRLTSYVFHEVRVPLNTALLAVQNMEASGTVAKEQEIEFKALEGSLSMMSKVLNDVLDFNRMDSGRFESVLKPYSFHQVMRSLFVPLQLATNARGLSFVTDLDPKIDQVARVALYEALGHSKENIAKRLAENAEEDGIVVGDETRLRQVITNLASNACKFTPTGGRLEIKTRLVLPHIPGSEDTENGYMETEGCEQLPKDVDDLPVSSAAASPSSPSSPSTEDHPDGKATAPNGNTIPLSTFLLNQHNARHTKPAPLEWIVVRIEVTDTGCGIRPKDMIQSKLFSAFNQTEQGRQQGGKGTGLGLALVRQIVKLSGGRLGVKSKVNEGSTFWVELPLGVGSKAVPGLLSGGTLEGPEWALSKREGVDRRMNGLRDVQFENRGTHGRGGSGQGGSGGQTTRHGASPSNDDHSPGRNSSALHSLMEQGGLVEISTRRGESSVPTRTIGDPSTGTDAVIAPSKSSPSPSLAERRMPVLEDSSETVKPPQHLQLPKPQRFSLDDPVPDVSPGSTNTGSALSQAAAASSHSSSAFDPGLRVLVVDDDPLTRKLMSRMLTRLGCKVYTAENGEIALEMILGTGSRPTPSSEDTGSGGLTLEGEPEEYKFAVVFLDNQMPVLSGLEAVGKLRSMGRRDFVVGVTGNALLTDQQEYLEAGVDHVLTKPVYEKSLKTMLSLADERRKRGTPASERGAPSLPPQSPISPTSL
ncbi:hypothetical protein K474DRAFT_1700572 [Panus rudis PR-1116 ss-1]|nr:hypothetical protein K474DRAFT_1700572 [Panus rudis PR-1116 ss-1]